MSSKLDTKRDDTIKRDDTMWISRMQCNVNMIVRSSPPRRLDLSLSHLRLTLKVDFKRSK
jgi:hypothetical protein